MKCHSYPRMRAAWRGRRGAGGGRRRASPPCDHTVILSKKLFVRTRKLGIHKSKDLSVKSYSYFIVKNTFQNHFRPTNFPTTFLLYFIQLSYLLCTKLMQLYDVKTQHDILTCVLVLFCGNS